MRNVPGLEAIYRDYKEKGVEFYFVYKSLAHPEKDGLVQPVTVEERLAHVERAKKQLGTTIPWLADSLENDLKNALGDRNNSEIVISPDGEMVVARDWSDPVALRADLERLVGKADTLTSISDLDLPVSDVDSRRKTIPSGIVPRVPRPDQSEALFVTAMNEAPHYLKLRAEAEKSVTREGSGKLHLSFQLDPIHEVHWNNLAPPMKFSITSGASVSIEPTSGEAAKVTAAESDRDPREFLVSIEGGSSEQSLIVEVDYFACDDADQWCKPVTQTFEVSLAVDRDAGRVQIPGGGSRGGKMKGGGSGRGIPSPEQMLSRFDTNDDGLISTEEAGGPMERRFDQMDTDGNGSLTLEELKTFLDNR